MKKRIFTLMMAFLAIAGNAVWGQENINITGIETQLPTPSQGTGWKLTHEDIGTAGNKLVISQSGKYVITDAADAAADNSNIQIIVNGNLEDVEITVKNVKTNAQLNNNLDGAETDDKYSNRCAFEINSGTTVTLNWEGTNKFWSSPERAGINVKPGATLILNDEDNSGTLEAGSLCNGGQAHTYGAGIGGDQVEPNFGTIIIENGQINARCESKGNSYSKFDALAAGIGGGYSDTETSIEGTIIIKGGTIEAASWSVDNGKDYESDKTGNQYSYGAGIGGGWKGTCTNIAILGGKVTSNSKSGDDIGVGYQYNNGVIKGIIIGQWDENTKMPEIIGDVNHKNLADGRNAESISGSVTMPAKTQVYIPAGFGDIDQFKAYNIVFRNKSLNDEGDESHSSQGNLPKEVYYYGPSQTVTINDMTCNDGHLFLGWYEDDKHFVASEKGSSTFTMPAEEPSAAPSPEIYFSVWVDNDYTIVVPSGKTWSAEDSDVPYIYTVCGNKEDYLETLIFSFDNTKVETTYSSSVDGLFYGENKLSFEGNKLVGTPTLPEGMNYLQEDIDAYVKLGESGTWKALKIHIRCAENIVIDGISKSQTNHIYDGKPHNGLTEYRGDDNDHLLKVSMMADWGDSQITESDLKEGVHYRISSYMLGGNTIPAEGESSALITDAGTYSDVTVEAKDGVTFASSLTSDRNSYKLQEEITVAQRPMNIIFSLAKSEIEEGEEPTVNIIPEELGTNRGLVEGEEPGISCKIDYQYNEDQTQMTVTIKKEDITVSANGNFKPSNYDMKYVINGVTYRLSEDQDGDEDVFPDEGVEIGTIPVTSSSTGGSFNDHRYQLFLANKDYLKTDKRTVEYYEDLKLELFSLHKKKYTDVGGSFTVWYEKNGEANVGGYRIFWSNRANGEYKEVKFDPVSEYFQIRDVHSDVYVKIYAADGFPVGNEEIAATDFRAYAQPNKIIVITPEPTDVQIISMAGAVVAADKVTGQREFANLAEGVYIVRMGETIVKLQVRN